MNESLREIAIFPILGNWKVHFGRFSGTLQVEQVGSDLVLAHIHLIWCDQYHHRLLVMRNRGTIWDADLYLSATRVLKFSLRSEADKLAMYVLRDKESLFINGTYTANCFDGRMGIHPLTLIRIT